MTKKVYVIVSKQIDILDNNDLRVVTNNESIGYCAYSEISDFPIINLKRFFSNYPTYKFKVIGINDDNTLKLSYKQCHPKLMKDKRKIVSTANHYKTLRKTVSLDIKNYDEDND